MADVNRRKFISPFRFTEDSGSAIRVSFCEVFTFSLACTDVISKDLFNTASNSPTEALNPASEKKGRVTLGEAPRLTCIHTFTLGLSLGFLRPGRQQY